MAKDGCTRGLEQRVCFERQRRRYLGNRGIVAAHKSMQYSPDRLALLASKCNRWASKIAVAEAALDFVQAYYDNDKKRDSEPIQTLNKRSYEEYEEVQVSGRRVRRRIHCSYDPILRESEEGSFSWEGKATFSAYWTPAITIKVCNNNRNAERKQLH